jgi:predicted DNA-binding transcriptional regulator YafY
MESKPTKRLKLLYVMEYLLAESDENHPVTLEGIHRYLHARGIDAERKSIYNDLNLLRLFGMDIQSQRGRDSHYRLLSRPFELAELKLLVDAVESSRFITPRKTRELVAKLAGLTSRHQADSLQHPLIRTGKVKAGNESVFYAIDAIHQAIEADCQISFRYLDYSIDRNVRFRRGGERYHVSPYAMTWDDENYYLIAHYARYGHLSQFRIDRMNDVQVSEQPRIPLDPMVDLGDYVRSTFGMFSGQAEELLVRFERDLIHVVVDRFGRDVPIQNADERHFSVRIKVVTSPAFWGWLFMFGAKAQVLAPEPAVEAYRHHCQAVLAAHNPS